MADSKDKPAKVNLARSGTGTVFIVLALVALSLLSSALRSPTTGVGDALVKGFASVLVIPAIIAAAIAGVAYYSQVNSSKVNGASPISAPKPEGLAGGPKGRFLVGVTGVVASVIGVLWLVMFIPSLSETESFPLAPWLTFVPAAVFIVPGVVCLFAAIRGRGQ
jgi:hypothetical protein